jgi:hypothetical protein
MRLSLENAVNKFNSVPEEYRTDWSKLLMDVDKSRGVLRTLIQSLFGFYGGNIIEFMDLDMTIAPKQVTMIFANTKDKNQQDKLVKLIQDTLGQQYIVVVLGAKSKQERTKMVERTLASNTIR